jgi:sulfoxide reductase heme-binding subunit YedZ
MPVAAANAALRRLPTASVYALGLLPAPWLFWLALTGGLGPDPAKALEHRYGEIALQLLVATLAVTPVRRLTGLSLLRFRRAFGLLSFAYVLLHVTVWLVLDVQGLAAALAETIKRPFIMIGMVGFMLLIPLALTSTDAAMRRMGPQAWRSLHRLTYPAALAGSIHYLLLVKSWPLEPFLYLGAILLLLALRLPFPLRLAGRTHPATRE